MEKIEKTGAMRFPRAQVLGKSKRTFNPWTSFFGQLQAHMGSSQGGMDLAILQNRKIEMQSWQLGKIKK